ncbi:MAG TPA: ATP citrate lyase citrate-binding domain-containing protein [Candidatus Paceibacterota bacterium]|nr:ATP citrate lyase citrate-binding domain-containing protein [Candidatus Paceibacterota bacterium]
MSRVKLTEYRAKKILLGDAYRGVSVRAGEKTKLPASGKWVAKVDQGIKKRMKQGLVAVDVNAAKAQRAFATWRKKGFSQFLLEPLLPHKPEEEQYLSLERVRHGIRMLHAREGGIDIEANPKAVKTYLITDNITKIARESGLPEHFLSELVQAFNKHFFAFLEINPLVVREDVAIPLDAAVLVDSAGGFFTRAWSEDDLVKGKAKHDAEGRIEQLAATTPAQLALKVLNKDGALFFLFSGGGGSIVIADEAQLQGVGDRIGNYGEYSGGPTREETHLYAREVIKLLLASNAKKKALVIAGGVANFTDIAKTFAGIIDALTENADKLRKQGIKVFVRRGGPNEKAGLELMRDFLKREKLLGTIYGSDTVITKAVDDAIKFVGKK